MTRPWFSYAALSVLLVCAAVYETGYLGDLVKTIRRPEAVPAAPFSIQIATRTVGSAGPYLHARILALNGKPFTAQRQFDDAVGNSHPGDRLHLVLSLPSGRAVEADVVIPAQSSSTFQTTSGIALLLCLSVLIPLLCLGLGFGAVFMRPTDRNAWLLLMMLGAFGGFLGAADWHRSMPDLSFFWNAFCGGSWAFWMMLFAIYFPSRFGPDRRYPWVKFAFLVPAIAVELAAWGIEWLGLHDINAAQQVRPLLMKLVVARTVMEMIGVGAFFLILGVKSGTEKSPDDRRRLKILRTGTSVSLAPLFLVASFSLLRDREPFVGIPWPVEVTTLFMLALFPLTLVYVIVVDRAMDLGFVVRVGVKYGLAKGVLWLVRAGSIAMAYYFFAAGKGNGIQPLFLVLAGAAVVIVRRRNADNATRWLDKKFFREAYDAEAVLVELAGEVGQYLETGPLIEKVAQRVPATLHVPDVVVLLREGDVYRPRYSTRPGQPMDVRVDGSIANALRAGNAPLEVYFDKPPAWIRALDAEEIQTLDHMRTQLLLPIPGKGDLAGMMSLGPKLSEASYSTTDRRLLQSVAVHMGMALENSRLMASLAEATAHREVIHRELEIAREVQERLFPQKFPAIAGVDCFGYCRPARGVGGDYYDFIEAVDGKLGIAIGDVSGKGIAAALLMASLQASLRGQTMAGIHDLAGLMRNVNKLVYDASQSNRYATFFYAELDLATRKLHYVNAGHNAPMVLRGEEVLRLEACGPVVGLLPGAGYTMDVCQMRPGDIFVGYTDGISEAMNEQDEEWEEERFLGAAHVAGTGGAKDIIEAVFRQADAFTGAAKQYDDMTLVVMKLAA